MNSSLIIGTGIFFLVVFGAAFIYCNTIPIDNFMVNIQTGERLNGEQFAERQNPFLFFSIGFCIFVIILGLYGNQQNKIQKVKTI